MRPTTKAIVVYTLLMLLVARSFAGAAPQWCPMNTGDSPYPTTADQTEPSHPPCHEMVAEQNDIPADTDPTLPECCENATCVLGGCASVWMSAITTAIAPAQLSGLPTVEPLQQKPRFSITPPYRPPTVV